VSSLLTETTPHIPSGFLYKDASSVEAKIIEFKKAGTSQLQLVLDFDRTLTEKSDENSTSWQLMRNHLPPEGKVEAQAVFDRYRALEIAGTLSSEDATTWWTTTMGIVAKYHLDMNVVEREFLSYSTIRPGTKELFELCAKHNIPTIIMSAGVKDIIEMWCRAYDIHPTIILSTELTLDEDNRVTGWKDGSVVHMFNKHELGHPELSKIRATRSHTILAGDSIHDYNMAEGTDMVFRARIVDLLDYQGLDQATVKEETFKLFDVIIENGTLAPIYQLLQTIVGQ